MSITVPDQNIAAGVKVPDSMNTLGNIMNVANSANQLQSGNLRLQGETQANDDRVAAAQFMQDPSNWQNDDGTINLTKANNIMKIAPQAGSDVVQKLSTLAGAQTTAAKAKMDMGSAGRSVIGGLYGVLGRSGIDNPTTVSSELDQLKNHYGPDSPITAYANAAKVGLQHLPSGSGAVKNMLISQSQALMSPESQQTALSPTAGTFNKGTDVVPMVSQPAVGGNAPSISIGANPIAQTQITPGQAESVGTDQAGNPTVVNRNVQGKVTGMSGMPVSGQAPVKPMILPAGETQDTLKVVQGYRQAANASAAEAPNQAFNANQIIKYSKEGFTGSGANGLAKASAIFPSLPWSGDKATDTQLLGHAIAQQTASVANSAGLNGSNAARDIGREMTADGSWTPEAIQSSSRVMRAIGDTGARLYNVGIENAVKNGGPFAAREFKTNWSNAANLDGIRLYDAKKNIESDPEGMKQVVQSLGGPTNPRYLFALKKIDQMGALVQGRK